MNKRNIIVIGASAGGFDALKQLIANLPADIDASIFIVWHMAPDVRGILPQVLNQQNKILATNAVNHEPVQLRRIYVAPPDHHMLLDDGKIRTTRGPKENRFRPAVDPLFRSAAYSYGSRVIGVVLSGALDDGSAGLWTIKQYGGFAIVQDPAEAEVPSMPQNAMRAVQVDYVLPIKEISALIARLVKETVPPSTKAGVLENEKVNQEINIAMEKNMSESIFEFSELTRYTCPECHGVLSSIKEGDRVRFRCHTGHAFSADSLLATITGTVEESLWSAIRNVQESVFLLNHMGDHFAEVNEPKLAATYFKKAKEAAARADVIRNAVYAHEPLSANIIGDQANADSHKGNGKT